MDFSWISSEYSLWCFFQWFKSHYSIAKFHLNQAITIIGTIFLSFRKFSHIFLSKVWILFRLHFFFWIKILFFSFAKIVQRFHQFQGKNLKLFFFSKFNKKCLWLRKTVSINGVVHGKSLLLGTKDGKMSDVRAEKSDERRKKLRAVSSWTYLSILALKLNRTS